MERKSYSYISEKKYLYKIIFIVMVLMFLFSSSFAQDKPDYSPKYSGFLRAWHQTDFSTDQGQFLLKQVRFGVSGNVNEYAGYKLLVDFLGLWKLSTSSTDIDGTKVLTSASLTYSDILLDAAAILTPVSNLEITAGQFKVPFSSNNLSADQTGEFANRPLVVALSPSVRDMGAQVGYKIKGDVSVQIIAGAFNGAGLNKSENDKNTDYAFRGIITPLKDLNFSGNYYKGKAQGADNNFMNFGVNYKLGDFYADAEYSNKVSKTLQSEITGNTYYGLITYTLSIPGGFLKNITTGARYEILEPNTSKDNDEISRITLGLTFDFAKISFAHFRINYEKFDYKDGRANPNKLIFELQTRF